MGSTPNYALIEGKNFFLYISGNAGGKRTNSNIYLAI